MMFRGVEEEECWRRWWYAAFVVAVLTTLLAVCCCCCCFCTNKKEGTTTSTTTTTTTTSFPPLGASWFGRIIVTAYNSCCRYCNTIISRSGRTRRITRSKDDDDKDEDEGEEETSTAAASIIETRTKQQQKARDIIGDDDDSSSTNEVSSSSSRWVSQTCRRLLEQDPDLRKEGVEFDAAFILGTGSDDDDDDDDDIADAPGAAVSDEDLRALSSALGKNRTATRLYLRNFTHLNSSRAETLASAVRLCSTLEFVTLEDCDEDSEGYLAAAVTAAVAANPSITNLVVDGCWTSTTTTTAADGSGVGAPPCRITDTLRSMCSIGHLVDLQISHNHELFGMDDDNNAGGIAAAKAMAAGLRSETCSIRTLNLTGNGMNDAAIIAFFEGLLSSTPTTTTPSSSSSSRHSCRCLSLETLSLDFNAFGDAGVASVAKFLAASGGNNNLIELHLFGNRISPEGATFLAEALEANNTLECLILSFNQIGNEGCAALARALTVNQTLRKLWIPSNFIGAAGISAFATALPRMRGLEELHVGLLLDDDAAAGLVDALQHNAIITVLHMETPASMLDLQEPMEDLQVEWEDDNDNGIPSLRSSESSGSSSSSGSDNDNGGIASCCEGNFYLRLNRAGRRYLHGDSTTALGGASASAAGDAVVGCSVQQQQQQPSPPQPSLWPHVLAACHVRHQCDPDVPDVLHYMVRQKMPELLLLQQQP